MLVFAYNLIFLRKDTQILVVKNLKIVRVVLIIAAHVRNSVMKVW